MKNLFKVNANLVEKLLSEFQGCQLYTIKGKKRPPKSLEKSRLLTTKDEIINWLSEDPENTLDLHLSQESVVFDFDERYTSTTSSTSI